MEIYEELKARGLIVQVTDEEEIKELKAIVVNNADWLLDLKYVDLLRDAGARF